MDLKEKSLEELQACEAKISEQLQAKKNEKIISEGGFYCFGCGKAFEKKNECHHYPGSLLCQQCGNKKFKKETVKFFEDFENFSQGKTFELIGVRFARGSFSEEKDIEVGYGERSAKLSHFIFKMCSPSGVDYIDICLDYDHCGCDDDDCAYLKMDVHSKPPTWKESGKYWVWEE